MEDSLVAVAPNPRNPFDDRRSRRGQLRRADDGGVVAIGGEALQKITRPVVTAEGLVTVAVSVAAVPLVIEEEDSASVVVVVVAACATGADSRAIAIINTAIATMRKDTRRRRKEPSNRPNSESVLEREDAQIMGDSSSGGVAGPP